MLDQIPAEILAHIAFHLSITTLSPPVPLLQSCKSIHSAISPSTNHRLYGRLFRSAFDTAAAERRIGSGGINAGNVTQELKRRVIALNRIERMVQAQLVFAIQIEDLWVLYIMLIENGGSNPTLGSMADGVDGKNIQHFIGEYGHVHLDTFLKLYHDQQLLPAAVEPGYPSETTERALIMWISWLLSGYR